jgi:hypothetical protein
MPHTGMVRKSVNYDQFKIIKGNRSLNKANLNKIRVSCERDKVVFSVLIVNERMEIIDGQHRFTVFKELGEPIYYIVKRGYGLKEVQIYNGVSRKWGTNEWADSFASLGYDAYKKYVFFRGKYKFGHRESMALLSGTTNHGETMAAFTIGRFQIKDWADAVNKATMIYDFEPYYKNYRKREFVLALLKVFKVKGYSHRRMLQKVRYQSAKLLDQAKVVDYLLSLEKIYNYRRTDEYLRFDLPED